MSGYAGWNLFGALSGVFKNQGINILLNIFFGPIVNAAMSISSQISNAVSSFSLNFVTAVQPQIIKLYSAGRHEEMLSLVFRSSKMTAYLMYIFVLPLFFEMPKVIALWLGQVPEYVVLFTRLILIDALLNSVSNPLMTAAQATGRIKRYQIVVGGILLLNLPLSFFVLKMGAPSQTVFIVGIGITLVAFVARLYLTAGLVQFSVSAFLKKVVIPVIFVFGISLLVPVLSFLFLGDGLFWLFVSLLLCVGSVVVTVLFFGITKDERQYFFEVIKIKVCRK
jgi:O-antigen/teichoic acid export membrane protein